MDLQNYSRDLKTLLKDFVAHVFIDNFKRKQKANPSFYYAHKVDGEGRLKYVFRRVDGALYVARDKIV